jgi:monothiol glutaredoxin
MSEHGSSPFEIASELPRAGGTPVEGDDRSLPALDRVSRMVQSSDIFVFIKGTSEQPMCGFSANTVAIMNSLGVPYSTFDVLSDESIRSAAKEHAGWPTFPQLYVRGEFVGGNDIITEMLHSGELQQLVEGLRK